MCVCVCVCVQLIEKREYEQPFPIQMQAIPSLMAGRDVIGIAETGSGKTLAYVLPMLRHILDQPPLKDGDGPIALVCMIDVTRWVIGARVSSSDVCVCVCVCGCR